jgi:dethiobiotin synthetase
MNLIFHDFIETFMQIYIDDIVVKSVSGKSHIDHLRLSFERMRKHGLKIAGATYQRAMNSIFHDFIETFMQIYIDDIVVKYVSRKIHINHLRLSFERMRRHGLKMNPLKCAFCVQAGDFLGFVVHKKGIEINQNKTKAIMEAKLPSTKKELQSLLSKINFLRRFISNLSRKTQAFSHLLRLNKEGFE